MHSRHAETTEYDSTVAYLRPAVTADVLIGALAQWAATLDVDDLVELAGRRPAIRPEDTTPSPWAEGSTVESDT